MQTVETSVWVDAPLDRTYAVAKDNESFPRVPAKDVKSLEIVEREGNRIVSDRVGLVLQFMLKVRWRQEDVWNDEAHTASFANSAITTSFPASGTSARKMAEPGSTAW
ncbi:MAG: hypothetical protein U0S12_14080 [Fimbriimonadales bacterium]